MKKFLHSAGTGVKGRGVLNTAAGILAAVLAAAFLTVLPVSAIIPVHTPGSFRTGDIMTGKTGAGAALSILSSGSRKSAKILHSSSVKLSRTKYTYDGHSKKPSVTVKYSGKKLKKNRDYTVSYRNNKKRGTAKVIVRGKGKYKGTVTKTFQIK
jgi:hypothetical protein